MLSDFNVRGLSPAQDIIEIAQQHFDTTLGGKSGYDIEDRFYLIGYVSGYYDLDWQECWRKDHAFTLSLGLEDGQGDRERDEK